MTVTTQAAKDYSAKGEQPIILDVLSKMGAIKDQPVFLDLGAGDGYRNSNTRALSDQGWRGVLVEHDPREFVRLLNNHKGNSKMSFVLGRTVSMVTVDPHRPSSEQRVRLLSAEELTGWGVVVTPWELAQVFGGRFEFVSVEDGCGSELVHALEPCLTHTRLVCFGDRTHLINVWAELGFTEMVGQTTGRVLLCRKEWAPGYAQPGDAVKASSVEALKEHGAPPRKWFNEETLQGTAPMRTAPPPAPPEVIADPKARMARARSFVKMSPAEAGRKGGLARARREAKP